MGLAIDTNAINSTLGCILSTYDHQHDGFGINDNLPRFAKVYCDFPANVRLDLSGSPIGLRGMLHQHSRRKDRTDI